MTVLPLVGRNSKFSPLILCVCVCVRARARVCVRACVRACVLSSHCVLNLHAEGEHILCEISYLSGNLYTQNSVCMNVLMICAKIWQNV